MKLYSYNQGSQSAKALAEALGIKRIKHEGPRLDMRGSTLINWGASRVVRPIINAKLLNPPEAIAKASNKLTSFLSFTSNGNDVPCPEFTTDLDVANEWLAQGFDVVQRDKLNGHSGEGIVIWEAKATPSIEDDEPAPLYTKYVKKKDEYRIHVFQGEVIFEQRKARKKDVPDELVNWKVRNLAGGFIFSNIGVVAPDRIKDASVAAVKVLGLDFGAVDCILGSDGNPYVLEVNTACGLEGTTIERYVEKFKEFV